MLPSRGVSWPTAPWARPRTSPICAPHQWLHGCAPATHRLPCCRCLAPAAVASGGGILPWVWCWSPGKEIRLMPHRASRGHRSQPKSCLCFQGRLSTCQGFPPAPAVGAQPRGRGFASRGQHSVALYHTWAVGAKGRAGTWDPAAVPSPTASLLERKSPFPPKPAGTLWLQDREPVPVLTSAHLVPTGPGHVTAHCPRSWAGAGAE